MCECVCVSMCVWANIFIGFYLHCSNCAISHCTITNSFCRAQSIPIVRASRGSPHIGGGRERERGAGKGSCVCVSRAFYVFFAYFAPMQAKWIYGNFSNAFGTIMSRGGRGNTRHPQRNLSDRLLLLGLHLLHPAWTDLKLQLAGLLLLLLLAGQTIFGSSTN